MNHSRRLSENFRYHFRLFVYWYFNGSLLSVAGEDNILEEIDYRIELAQEASLMETAFAIYTNNIELDEEGNVLNQNHAIKRSAQYIRDMCDRTYTVVPAFEEWELELF